MTNKLKDLYNGQPGATNTTLYTAPANTTTRILAATVSNSLAAAKFLIVYRVPSGDSPGLPNVITGQKVVSGLESMPLWELVGQVLEVGDSIIAVAEAATQLTVHISGVEIT